MPEEILKAADQAGALTNQLLAFSRRQVMQPRIINLNAVIGQTERCCGGLIGEDIQLVMSLDRTPATSKPDPDHRASHCESGGKFRDAMPNGGRTTIETGNVQIDETYVKTHMGVKPGDFVMSRRQRHGSRYGFRHPAEHLRAFLHHQATGKGTGLGLATVYGMVKQSGGDIWVYSEPGQGTTFKLYFPLVQGTASPRRHGESGISRQLSGETVLLVEDEARVREAYGKNVESSSAIQSSPPRMEMLPLSQQRLRGDCPVGDGRRACRI